MTLDADKYELATITTIPMSFSYIDNTKYVFMDQKTYETVEIDQTRLE
jgi:translation elongation factor P/translation initiation factor 5A